MNLLEVRNLKVHFPVRDGLFRRAKQFVRAVDDVSFTVGACETVGLVGESGCGKTTLGRAVIRLIEPTSGQVLFKGEDITRLNGSTLRSHRRKFQMISHMSSNMLALKSSISICTPHVFSPFLDASSSSV